ncbi:MAG: hypothetical protein ACREUC_17455 [Steroidobacteraceae bacterium]
MNGKKIATFVFLVALGSLQMAAEVLGMPKLKAVAATAQVAPAMKVFTAHQGYETHAARFSLHWRDARGQETTLQLTPETYAKVGGPYNRRNVYGAAFAYGPLLRVDPLTRPMHDSVMRYALCKPGVLREELDIPRDVVLTARVTPVRPPPRDDLELEWEVSCVE